MVMCGFERESQKSEGVQQRAVVLGKRGCPEIPAARGKLIRKFHRSLPGPVLPAQPALAICPVVIDILA